MSQTSRSSAGSRLNFAKKLAGYSVAVGAGVGALSAGECEAVVRPFNPVGGPIVVPETQSSELAIDFDIDGDGRFDFHAAGYFGFSLDGHFFGDSLFVDGSYMAVIVAQGEMIGQGFGTQQFAGMDNFIGTRGFAGVVFDIPGGSPHFGYLDVEVAADESQMIIYGGAYETQANTPIAAGAIPEPTGLGLLAMGSAGLATRRRKD